MYSKASPMAIFEAMQVELVVALTIICDLVDIPRAVVASQILSYRSDKKLNNRALEELAEALCPRITED